MGAAHKRVEFVPQSYIQRQIALHLPAVANIPAVLPFAPGHFNVLDAFAYLLVEAEQKCSPRIVLIGCRAAVQRGDGAIECNQAARSVRPGFRLPLVELKVDHVEASANLMGTMRLKPTTSSSKRLGVITQLCPIVGTWTSVGAVPAPPLHSPGPPAAPRPNEQFTNAFMALYLPKM